MVSIGGFVAEGADEGEVFLAAVLEEDAGTPVDAASFALFYGEAVLAGDEPGGNAGRISLS